MTEYRIHPSIGVARLGTSHFFYLAPEEIGGLPLACDEGGDRSNSGEPGYVERFRDAHGKILRQAARFKVFEHDDAGNAKELDLSSPSVSEVEWTVHLANKKSAWYQFEEPAASKEHQETGYVYPDVTERQELLRNKSETKDRARKLITDPGPRTLKLKYDYVEFDADHAKGYAFASFPCPAPSHGLPVKSLGTMRLDGRKNLLVLGGSGNAGGPNPFSSFTGADGWFDDISDGAVRCTIKLRNGDSLHLHAWVIIAPPKYAPEIVNIVTLDDTLFDLACRAQNLDPSLRIGNKWNDDYIVDFKKDVKPLIERFGRYNWVAGAPYMSAFSAPGFDVADNSLDKEIVSRRLEYFKKFRRPNGFDSADGQENVFETRGTHFPLMPLGAGNNPLTSNAQSKFLSLTPTQYFFLRQWAHGKFSASTASAPDLIHPLDRASVGNCVGGPVSPGYEVTWSMRCPLLYDKPFSIKHRCPDGQLHETKGLSASYDETKTVDGCEPGDLTKRMSTPWHADFIACGTQMISFRDSAGARGPTFMASWWPPQVPETVIAGRSAPGAEPDETYGSSRSFLPLSAAQPDAILEFWSCLGFITNQVKGEGSERYPFYAESERDQVELSKLESKRPG